MSSLNKVMLIGNCGKDPEIRYTLSGDAVVNISLTTSERFKDRTTGENREQTEEQGLVFFGKLAEIVGEYVRKGSSLYVERKIRTRKWIDQRDEERYITEIVDHSLKMLSQKSNHSQKKEMTAVSNPCTPSEYTKKTGCSTVDEFDNNILF